MALSNLFTKTIEQSNGRSITIETGKLAKQSNGAVVLRDGKTMLLATVVASADAREGADFLPLTVDYQEKFSASGRIPGGFLKRESRLSNYEILISRMIDRAIRPLFPDDYHNELQVMVSLISLDEEILPDSLTAFAVSSALSISDIPFDGPISEVRVARINGELRINPLKSELEKADIDMIVAGNANDINMVEGSLDEVSEADMVEALKFAHEEIKKHCAFQKEMVAEVGKPKSEYTGEENDEDVKKRIFEYFEPKIKEIASKATHKDERSTALKDLWTEFEATLTEEEAELIPMMKRYFGKIKKEAIRNVVLDTKQRLDGRKYNEIREIECEVDYLPSAHGSAVFTRGETQSLSSVTLGGKLDELMIDGAVHKGYENFMLHYNFPPFSTGEVRPNRGPGRREIGHGNLAKRALEGMLPGPEINPYTIRIISDILESNGSSSMATVCAGCLALMDAGIQIKSPVSGIAMGLIMDNESGKYAVLSDILGDEDHLGDMDFKVTGTEKGITACQMDIKVDGLSYDLLTEALLQAREGRLHILGKMREALAAPRDNYKPHAPRIDNLFVPPDTVGGIIGSGGKTIQKIQAETGSHISIEDPEEGKAKVQITAPNQESLEKAKEWIELLIAKPEAGKVYKAKVKSVVDFGAFLEYLPNHEGLLHNSEYSMDKNEQTCNMVKEGDILEVKLIEYDFRSGKSRLSRRALDPDYVEQPREFRRDRRDGGHGRGRNSGNSRNRR